MVEFSFTLFKPHKNRSVRNDDPLVAIKPNGRIIFNKKATELLNKNYFCMLGYDPDNKALGILPMSAQETNAFPVRYAAKGAYIGAKKFFKHFGILPERMVEGAPFTHDEFIGLKM
jgi:hypothetical protein